MSSGARGPGLLGLQLLGVALFLFIPLVLWLFVGQPRPLWLATTLGVVLMLGHRLLARPYMRASLGRKCLWCNGRLPRDATRVALETAGGRLDAATCPRHREPLLRTFGFLDRYRVPLRAGIFLPLLALLVALGVAAAGTEGYLGPVTAAFQLVVGITVNAAAFGPFRGLPAEPARVPFPAHNFALLGVRALLWIFRLVGLWWIAIGAWRLFLT